MSSLATDDFNRANAQLTSGNWSKSTGFNALQIVSNVVDTVTANSDSAAYYNGVSWPNDQYSQVVISAVGGRDGGPACRISTGDDLYMVTEFGSGSFKAHSIVNGTASEIDSDTASYANNDVVYIEAQGTTIITKQNGTTRNSVTNSAIASGNAGMFMFDGTLRFDNWEGGDFSAGGITGTLAKTLGDATVAGAGSVAISGAAAKTLGAATAAGSGTVAIAGAASKTLGDATAGAAGSVSITGAAAVTLGAATLVAAGSSSDEIIGTLDKTLGAATAVGAGSVAISGAAAPALGAAAAAAGGTVDITGQGAATLGAATVHASDASAQGPAAIGGDFASGQPHRGYNLKRAKLRLKKDREHEQSIRQIYRDLTADPVTRERAEAVIAPPIVERDDESVRQHAARVAARDRALRLEQLSAEKEIALRLLHQELREAQHEDDEKAVMELLGMVL